MAKLGPSEGRLANFQPSSRSHASDTFGIQLERGPGANLGFYRLFVLVLISILEGNIKESGEEQAGLNVAGNE
jgi:hypothetical protein